MRRLSVFRKPRDHATTTATTSGQSNLSHFLQLQKVNYLKAVDQGQAKQWTVVMGNEAGDLDSLASAIAYAWYATNSRKSLTVPLVQSPHADLPLRAENLHALALAGIDPDRDLLCLDDAPPLPLPSDKFALVDHNTLNSSFAHPGSRIIAVIDHHVDEGNYNDTADPRIVAVPTGSCASLVAPLLRDAPDTPPELATLLLAAICIDTDGLKPGSKAEQADRDAVALLLPRSSLTQQQPSSPTLSSTFATAAEPGLQRLTAELQAKKFALVHLGTRDLLRRDYKEYTCGTVRVGLASVPLALKTWLGTDTENWACAHAWMAERELDALGVLTSFRDERKLATAGRGKHQREQVWLLRAGDEPWAPRLWAGLEADRELHLKRKDVRKYAGAGYEARARVYKQGNASATRKAVAPLVRTILEDASAA